MLDFHFNLTIKQPISNPGLSILQEQLVSVGILMDLTFRDGSPVLHIRIGDRSLATEGLNEAPEELQETLEGHQEASEEPQQAPEEQPQQDPEQSQETPEDALGSGNPTNPAEPEIPGTNPQATAYTGEKKIRRGRRPKVPEHDLTIAQVREMQKNGTSLDRIARLIGVSRRTFFRKWTEVQGLDPVPETPFSKWSRR